MRKILLLFALIISGVSLAQTQPTVHNGTFDDIPKSSGSDSSSAGWINKDIADQGEDSTTGGSVVVKLDNVESDGLYQEFAVEANSNYTLNFSYINSIVSPTTTTTNIEVYVLKGSEYEAGYTPVYAAPLTAAQSNLGYRTVGEVETPGNQIATSLITPNTHTHAAIAALTFNTSTETSVAVFIRAVGPAAVHGDPDDDKGWMNGDSEVRIDNFTLVNNGLTVSNTPTQPTVHNGTFDDIPKSSGSDSSSAGWINKDIADQGEDSTTGGSVVVKLDNVESDGLYQEFAVETNSKYTLNFSYINSIVSPTTTTTNIEVYVLKGSEYEAGYTPVYAAPATAAQSNLGYRTVAAVETPGNQIATSLITPNTHTHAAIAALSFDTGAETSVAVFIRAVGPAAVHGDPDDDKGWMNGDSEVRIDNFTLVNNGYSNNNWNGGSTAWDTTGNWGLGTLPTEFNRVVVGNTGTNPVIGATTGVKAYNLNVNSAAALNITSGGSLTVEDLAVGNVTYNRLVTSDADLAKAWHLTSSPVVGETIDDLIANHTFAAGSGGSRIGISTYNNTSEGWDYLTAASTGNLADGLGYSTKLDAAGNISFTGTVRTEDLTTVALTKNTNDYNLLGNPFSAYINSKTFLEHADNTTEITNQQIWIWDSSADSGAGAYVAQPAVNEFQIAPGQGFFVEAAVAGNVTFAEANQSHVADTFEKSNNGIRTEVSLNLNDGVSNRLAKIYYIDNTTKGFDNGYEGELFRGVAQDFKLFTQLLENNSKNYQIQSLPKDYENLIVPVGIKAEANKEITFSAVTKNFPEGMKVFLEDRLENISTRLDEANTTYKVTLTEAIDGVGRFYLHTSSKSVLNVDDNLALDNIGIYKTNASTLRIVGLQQGNASAKMFTVLGKQVMSTSFKTNGYKDILLPNLAKGVYIVQLETEAGKLNKKIILE